MRKHLLSIGNSFSDDAHMYLYDVLSTDGIDDIIIANLYIGGCTLEHHSINLKENKKEYDFKVYDKNGYTIYNEYSILDGLKYTEWDYITFQQASYLSGIKESYYSNDGILYFDILRDYCLKNIKNDPKFLFHETWSYEKGFDGDTFRNYNYSQELMEIKINEVLNDVVKKCEYFSSVIPNMEIVKHLRVTHGRPVTRDGFHLYFGISRYVASLAFAKVIHNESKLYSNKTYDLVDENEKTLAKRTLLEVFDILEK